MGLREFFYSDSERLVKNLYGNVHYILSFCTEGAGPVRQYNFFYILIINSSEMFRTSICQAWGQ